MSVDLRPRLEAVIAELKRLRAEGVDNVYLTQDTLNALQERAKSANGDAFSALLSREFGDAAAGQGAQSGDSASAAGLPAAGLGGVGDTGERPAPVIRQSADASAFAAALAEHEKSSGRRGASATGQSHSNGRGAVAGASAATGGSSAAGGVAGASGSGGVSGSSRAAASSRPADVAAAQGLPAGVAPIPAPTPFQLPEGSKQERWQWLRQKVESDAVCLEHLRKGKKLVLGVGSLDAQVFFCGEAPGAEEEEQGEPFVGPAGQLLTKIIQAMGLRRDDVYIGNIMNWRPEHDKPFGNRAPVQAEMAYCLPHLMAQLEIVRPRVVVALGLTAANGLLGYDPDRRLGSSRGRWLAVGDYPLMITYHPSYLLRTDTLAAKRTVWEDLMLVMEKVGMPISDKQRAFFTKA